MDVNRDRAFNQHTGNHYDKCESDNSMRLSTKPLRYYTSVLNSPDFKPDVDFTSVGSARVFNVVDSHHDIQRPLPTSLRDPRTIYVTPYSTSPNLGQSAPSMLYVNTSSGLQFGLGQRSKKSEVNLYDSGFDRWAPNVDEITVQNAGQFNNGTNNVIFANGAYPLGGISSRNILYDAAALESASRR